MYYNIYWIQAKPNNRINGVAQLKKLALLAQNELDLSPRVFTNITTGPTNLLGLITPYESMAAMVNHIDAIIQMDSFPTWSQEALESLDFASAEWQTFRILRSGGAFGTANFFNLMAIHITPGKLNVARQMLSKLADHYESTYGRPVDILNLAGGLHYRHYVVIDFDTLEQYDEMQVALEDDKVFGQWTVDMMGMFDNTTIELHISRYM